VTPQNTEPRNIFESGRCVYLLGRSRPSRLEHFVIAVVALLVISSCSGQSARTPQTSFQSIATTTSAATSIARSPTPSTTLAREPLYKFAHDKALLLHVTEATTGKPADLADFFEDTYTPVSGMNGMALSGRYHSIAIGERALLLDGLAVSERSFIKRSDPQSCPNGIDPSSASQFELFDVGDLDRPVKSLQLRAGPCVHAHEAPMVAMKDGHFAIDYNTVTTQTADTFGWSSRDGTTSVFAPDGAEVGYHFGSHGEPIGKTGFVRHGIDPNDDSIAYAFSSIHPDASHCDPSFGGNDDHCYYLGVQDQGTFLLNFVSFKSGLERSIPFDRIRTGNDLRPFGFVTAMALSYGSVAVMEEMARTIRVFDSSGNQVLSIPSAGKDLVDGHIFQVEGETIVEIDSHNGEIAHRLAAPDLSGHFGRAIAADDRWVLVGRSTTAGGPVEDLLLAVWV
jgi:hypothetical protein